MSTEPSDERETRNPPVILPQDCRHSLEGYDATNRCLAWSCGVDEDGEPIMASDGPPRPIDGTGRDCQGCESFVDTRIRYPLTISGIESEGMSGVPSRERPGRLALVWFMEGDERMTELGIVLGELAVEPIVSYDGDTGVLSVRELANPAIFVPSVGRIVWGMESWWHETTIGDIERVFGDGDRRVALAKAWTALADGCDGTNQGKEERDG